jgi:copper homeostasis protein
VRLDEGGTTPNPELLELVRRAMTIPVFVLVRPRAGDFFYSADEINSMCRTIASAIDAGAHGIVTGALARDSRVDGDAMQELMAAGRSLPVTFHRAFDEVRDSSRALEALAKLGVARVLTSGGPPTASEGVDAIGELVKLSHDRVRIVAGGNIRAHNVAQILGVTRVREVHARLVDESSMRQLVDAVRMHAPERES